ncbi:tetratricopeptide repeat protein [Streptomyces sp. NPDC029080]|uniref:tetratricopeptide repeat protein n=1 Tax=Streptomyces sp. NPDC029080 TaxID=3155017 RepID=UPI0033FA0D72
MSDHIDFRGGRFRGQVVGKAEYRQHAPAPTALDALPPRVAGFTGRDDELGRLRTALDPAAGTGQAVLVTAVSGLGGIGKTALAVQAAYAAREAGWFPGGVLFVDLHGYDDAPVTADQALRSLLRALGVEPEHIPATADERAGLYRSLLAGREPVLIVADNASSPEQVRPLLPGVGRHRVLVTSRDRLVQLGARLVPVDQLTAEAACALLDRALRIADPDDTRVAAAADAAARLAELCGHLPLALQIAVALLAEDPGKTVEELADELATSYDRLTALDDGNRSVRAAFDLSYRRLPAGQARLLCLLALAPGPEVSEEVAAVLVGDGGPPSAGLKALARAHLVERGSGPGRWRMHDLVRVFGAGVPACDEEMLRAGDAARERLLVYYYRRADAADDRLQWRPGKPEPRDFATRADALAWLDRERAGLVAAAQWKTARYSGAAVRLALCLGNYLEWRRHLDDLIAVSTAAQEAAHDAGERDMEAMAWINLGNALVIVGRSEESMEASLRGRDMCRSLGDREGEAAAWNNLGLALRDLGRLDDAVAAHTRSCDLCRRLGDREGEAMAWNNLGLALEHADRVADAISAYTHALGLSRAISDRQLEASVWNNFGNALEAVGRVDEALQAYDRDLRFCLEFENWYGAAQSLDNLAIVLGSIGRVEDARAHYLRAADAYTRANAAEEAAEARAAATALTVPRPPDLNSPERPTDTSAPAAPPARTPVSVRPGLTPPGAPGTAGR